VFFIKADRANVIHRCLQDDPTRSEATESFLGLSKQEASDAASVPVGMDIYGHDVPDANIPTIALETRDEESDDLARGPWGEISRAWSLGLSDEGEPVAVFEIDAHLLGCVRDAGREADPVELAQAGEILGLIVSKDHR
jgi:hypothetical protein